jgi:CBS domain containing-hemolysin-like protein
VMSELGRLPAMGDEVPIEGGTLLVQRLDGRRIDRVRFVPEPAPAGTEAEEERR